MNSKRTQQSTGIIYEELQPAIFQQNPVSSP